MVADIEQVAWRREVSAADCLAVARLCVATDFFRSDEVEIAVELVEERLAKGDDSGYHFVFAELDGVVAGYASYGPIACTIGSFDLYWVVVDPAHQGRGLGRLLVGEVERLVKEAGGRAIYIDTSSRPQYAPTRSFYERLGYLEAARLEDFYDAGDGKVIFSRRVEG